MKSAARAAATATGSGPRCAASGPALARTRRLGAPAFPGAAGARGVAARCRLPVQSIYHPPAEPPRGRRRRSSATHPVPASAAGPRCGVAPCAGVMAGVSAFLSAGRAAPAAALVRGGLLSGGLYGSERDAPYFVLAHQGVPRSASGRILQANVTGKALAARAISAAWLARVASRHPICHPAILPADCRAATTIEGSISVPLVGSSDLL